MNAMLAPWWRERSQREQWLVLVATGLGVIVLVWLAVLRPLAMARERAEARHETAIAGLAQVAAAGNAIKAAQARGVSSAGVPLVEIIGERARAAGLTVESLGASGDGQVMLQIAAVKPPVLLRWIAEIETRDGVIVERASISRNEDMSVAVELALRRGAR